MRFERDGGKARRGIVRADCKGMRKQADGGSRIITGLGNRVREIEDCKGMRHRKD